MFTLKLYKNVNGQLRTEIRSVERVTTMAIGSDRACLLELWAHHSNSEYEVFYIGEPGPGMDAITPENHFGWGLLENAAGRTTQHFRPASYGIPS